MIHHHRTATPALVLVSLLIARAHAADDAFVAAITAAPVIDAVAVGSANPGHRFVEAPVGSSAVQTVAGIATRVMPATAGYGTFAVRLGEGRGLVAGATYVLEVDIVEDQPRTFLIVNRGDDTTRGVVCGASLPDTLYAYTSANAEALDVPRAGGVRTWRSVFTLSERTAEVNADSGLRPLLPADGFWVVVAQPEQRRLPGSGGAAVSAMRLRAIANPAALELTVRRPPSALPWRHTFWREEMSDGVITDADPTKRAFANRLDWFAAKIRTMRLLGYSAMAKDLLEFGANQGWDSSPYGGNDWVYQTSYPELWAGLVDLAGSRGVALLPYYEYTGSLGAHGLGYQKRCHPLGANANYTEISWVENANADLTDAETRTDFGKILDCTVLRLKDRARFLGVWLRPRPSELPISFADAALARFSAATGAAGVTRAALQADASLLNRYYAWWMQQRRAFLLDVRDRLRGGGIPDASVLYTVAATESTPALAGDPIVAESDTARWTQLVGASGQTPRPVLSLAQATADTRYADSLRAPTPTYGGWEWQHAVPWPDPQSYATTDGVCMTYQYNRRYTVTVGAGIDPFRAPVGLAMIRQYPLNEQALPTTGPLGYVAADMELAGPASVLNEVVAVANGDPRWLGQLNGRSLASGYPEYVRPFYAAFLALPALPSRRLTAATASPGVVVRAIDGGGAFGTWLAIANTGYGALNGVTITMPVAGSATDAATGATLTTSGATLTIDLAACSLRAVHIDTTTPVANVPPTVSAGAAQVVTLPTTSVTLAGSASDSDGAIASYAWTRVSGGAATIAAPASASTTVTGLAVGTYVFRLTATDNLGASASSDVQITVVAAPLRTPFGGRPHAIPGVIEAEDFDDGGEGVAYHDTDPTNNGGAYRTTAVDIRACSDAGGGFQVGWFVAGEWLEYSVDVATTGGYDLDARVANGASGGTLHIAIDGVDATGPLSIGNTGGFDTWADVVARNVHLTAGPHVLRIACDAGSADCNRVTITAVPPVVTNVPPTVALTAPRAGLTSVAPATIVMTADATDSDDAIARVEFYAGAVKLGQATTRPYGFTWTNAPAGTYVLSAHAIDERGAMTASTGITVTVTSGGSTTAGTSSSRGAPAAVPASSHHGCGAGAGLSAIALWAALLTTRRGGRRDDRCRRGEGRDSSNRCGEPPPAR